MKIGNFNVYNLKNLYIPPSNSHKGQNGKLLIIGGSKLFHGASLWALKVASRIVDMVFYSSVPENNEIVRRAKQEFRDGIVVRRSQIESYIEEADCVLIGPGMLRNSKLKSQSLKLQLKAQNLDEVNRIKNEGEQTYYLTKYLLSKHRDKKWVIDAGSLQVIDTDVLMGLNLPILTPHVKEFELLKLKIKNEKLKNTIQNSKLEEQIRLFAKEYNCAVLLKGQVDIVCSPFDSAQGETRCVRVSGGNAGMTKGGTGDVLAGLVAALYCKNDAFLSASSGSFINKKAGERLYERVGYYFNASDLADEIPKTMNKLIVR